MNIISTKKIGPALPLFVLAFIVVGIPQSRADLITDYTIDFTETGGSAGTPTPTGTIAWDTTNNTLNSYVVSWNGQQYDFTQSLMHLALMTLLMGGTYDSVNSPNSQLDENYVSLVISNVTYKVNGAVDSSVTYDSENGGTFTVATREPSALALLGTALAGLFFFRLRANRRDRQPRPLHQLETA